MQSGEKPGLSGIAIVLMVFTLAAMTTLGGLGVKALLDGLLRQTTEAESISDDEAYKLCIFSQRSPATCRGIIEERILQRIIDGSGQ